MPKFTIVIMPSWAPNVSNLLVFLRMLFHHTGAAEQLASQERRAVRNHELHPPVPYFQWPSLSVGQWGLFLLFLALGLALRWVDLGKFPRKFQTLDEYHYLWVGMSLLHDGEARAWSNLEAYRSLPKTKRGIVRFSDADMTIVAPALDHPPLFSVCAGAAGLLTGGRLVEERRPDGAAVAVWQIDLARARHLSLLLFVFTFGFLFGIARGACGFATGWLACLIYAVTTHIAFHNRLLVTENMTTPLFLWNLWILQRYVAGKSSRTVFGTVSVASTAGALLCKLAAVSQAAAIVYLLFLYGRRRDVVFPVLGVVLGMGLFCLYGWWQDWEIFLTILRNQAGRFFGFNVIQSFILLPAIVHNLDMHPLMTAGWICVFYQMLASRRGGIFSAAGVYLLAFAFFASVPAIYGWHVIPFYPFLCLALAATIREAWGSTGAARFAVLLLFLWGVVFHSIGNLGANPVWQWGMWFGLLACFLFTMFLPGSIRRFSMQSMLAIGIVGVMALEIHGAWTHEIWRRIEGKQRSSSVQENILTPNHAFGKIPQATMQAGGHGALAGRRP